MGRGGRDALNEQYPPHVPIHTLHLHDFPPEECLQNLYEESKTIYPKSIGQHLLEQIYMEECKDLEMAPSVPDNL